jgi:hypothetical protein
LNENDRSEAALGNLDFLEDHYILKCHMGVWEEGIHPAKEGRDHLINKTRRKNRCFFFPYQPGMLLRGAEEFQKREQNKHVQRFDMYMRLGLWLASIVLLANAIIWVLRLSE